MDDIDDDIPSLLSRKNDSKPGFFVPPVTTKMFSRNYFLDDDSLFGSSSEDEDSEDDDNDEEDDEQEVEISAKNDIVEKSGTNEVTSTQIVKDSPIRKEHDNDEEGEELDVILKELTVKDTYDVLDNKMKKKNGDAVQPMTNNVVKAKTNRKSWATTKLLPIRDFKEYLPNPALEFPFKLDDFQQQAIARLERTEAIFVAAHTSAGKTVVAEYAVALTMKRAARCVYTSPIKALSNQKFRDFSEKFGSKDIGLITGDIQVNVDDATCLIMTTEILRSMLYRGADLIRNVEIVIFDEVHYINDSQRGVVWEEVIIMLPSYVNLVFLSATTPNMIEFSEWIGRTKQRPVHVIKTDYRPVPLSHYLWAGAKLHKILEGKGSFIEAGYASAAESLLPKSAKNPNKSKAEQKGRPPTGSKQLMWQAPGSKHNWMSLVRFLEKEEMMPSLIFSFSKKKCEEIADMLSSLDLHTAKERSAVTAFTLDTINKLSDNDKSLPQVLQITEMVTRGIGVHHGGLLPILKEMVEILFSRNLIKVLLATETFAMGVNMPAKAVVFNTIKKHDGLEFRTLESGEYTQMAGRAGRRGLDTVGTVITCCFGEVPPPQLILRQMLTGQSSLLTSQFRLTYSMILNLLKVEEISVENMIKRSFSEFATQQSLMINEYPRLLARGVRTLEKLDEECRIERDNRIGADDLEEYFDTTQQILRLTHEVLSYICDNDTSSFEDLFHPGRILFITAARKFGVVCSPAIILRPPSQKALPHGDVMNEKMVCLFLLPSSYISDSSQTDTRQPGSVGYRGLSLQRHYQIDEVELDRILMISNGKRKTIDAKMLLKVEEKGKFDSQPSSNSMVHPKDPFAGMTPMGKKNDDPFAGMVAIGKKRDDPFAGMMATGKRRGDSGISPVAKEAQALDQAIGYLCQSEKVEIDTYDNTCFELHKLLKRGNDVVRYRQLCDRIYKLIVQMRSFVSHRHPNIVKYYTGIERKEALLFKVETLRHLLSNESLQLFPDFQQRKAVLRTLGYVDENEAVALKGRVACEVNTCETLIATEMVFEGILNELAPEEIAAALSALVFQEKKEEGEFDKELPETLLMCCEKMKTVAVNLGLLQKQHGLKIDPGEYCDQSLNFALVPVVYEWALGVPFKSICELTDAQEGSIVRCITRLDELCREIRNCARVVGNKTLELKLEAASDSIKRDIVFASSLYIK